MVHAREKSHASLGLQRTTRLEDWFNDPKPEEDPLLSLQGRFTEFTEKLSRGEQAAAKHVYNNPDSTPLDARQHRCILYALLAMAEELAIDFLVVQRPGDTAVYVMFLDEQLKRLRKILRDCYGEVEAEASTEFTAEDIGDDDDAILSNAISFSAARSAANQPLA